MARVLQLVLAGAIGWSSATAGPKSADGSTWPLWQSYAAHFITDEGRVIDPQADDRTTSEAQAYALFFALVANDRLAFDSLLAWTETALADGDLTANLPAWLWAKGKDGEWGVQDVNSAADSDVWLAYTLLEAGELWDEPAFKRLGRRLAERIAIREVRNLGGIGPMLLPGQRGFRPSPTVWQLNPSYLALPPLLGMASHLPEGPWARIAANAPKVILGSTMHGFAADWIAYDPTRGFLFEPLPRPEAVASYDAIRVYLWSGLLDPAVPARRELLEGLPGMLEYLQQNERPPAVVARDGDVKDPYGNIGFSAAVLPYLAALDAGRLAAKQQELLASAFRPETGLYTEQPGYYEHNLILFALGWRQRQYAFAPDGRLRPSWRNQ